MPTMRVVLKARHKNKIVLSLLILLFTATSHKPKETFREIVVYVNDPNGIFLFPDPKDIRNRIAVPYKAKLISLGTEKFSIPTKNNEEEEKKFEKLLYKEKVYYVEEDNSNKFIKLEPPNSDLYTYTQVPNATIYSLPFKDSKVVKRLPEFSLLEVISSYAYDRSPFGYNDYKDNWLEVDSKIGLHGFILAHEALRVDSLDKIQSSLKHKVKDTKGFFLSTSDKLVIYPYSEYGDEMQYIDIASQIHNSKINVERITRSIEKSGIRYYLLDDSKSPWNCWVAENYGRLLSDKEFSKFSFQNSKYSKDLNLFNIFEGEYNKAINFGTMEVSKFSSKKYKTEFYVIIFQFGMEDKFYYWIVERKSNQKKGITITFDTPIADGGQTVFTNVIGDMDGDGFPEFIGKESTRHGLTGTQLYSLKNGSLRFLGHLSGWCNHEFKGDYLNCYSISIIKDEKGEDIEKKKLEARYKLTKDKLYKEAANGKWEEVNSR